MNGLARSWRLLQGFRHEQEDPVGFYRLLADDTVALIGEQITRTDIDVLDIGGGPGYLEEALEALGARCITIDAEPGELRLHGREPQRAVVADGRRLPFADQTYDVCHSSNVLEHVDTPWPLLDEMVRVVRPGGLVVTSFTNWYSPWGGHETSPWHYSGGARAARRYERRHGRPPKNHYGTSLFPVHVRDVLRWARRNPDLDLVDAFPRYYPRWARPIVSVPGVREVLTWNLTLVVRRRW